MNLITIGKAIKQLRERKELSQEVLSGLANIDRGHLSKVELGKRNPSIIVIYKLADALGVRGSDILRAAEDQAEK